MKNLKPLKLASTLAVFCLAVSLAAPAQTFTTLLTFDGTNGAYPGNNGDGENGDYPNSGLLVQGINGNLFGTTGNGGNGLSHNGNGTVFEMNPEGVIGRHYNFCSRADCVDGRYPYTNLIQTPDGSLYGTTFEGGGGIDKECRSQGCGVVFRFAPDGTPSVIYTFCSQPYCADGRYPTGAPVLGISGSFYGVTSQGGVGTGCSIRQLGCGTIFEITPAGQLTTLYSFCTAGSGCSDGISPEGLVLAADGDFYGVAANGGIGYGTFFRITPGGQFTSLHVFHGTDGYFPTMPIQGTDGNFYATTTDGGANGDGTVFKITPGGVLTTLYNFCNQTNCTDGAHPFAGVVQASDGNFYGTTYNGGANQTGTVYEITPAGKLTTLYSFCSQPNCTDGTAPAATLLQATDGTFYGTTFSGGMPGGCYLGEGCGIVFSLSMGLPRFVEADPGFAKVGHTVAILGNRLTGTTSVTFNDVSANFKVLSDTLIRATVPSGATTGSVQVTTSGGILNSNTKFYVLP